MFLSISEKDMEEGSWYACNFILVTENAYVDHPSFGSAVIFRVLEAEEFKRLVHKGYQSG